MKIDLSASGAALCVAMVSWAMCKNIFRYAAWTHQINPSTGKALVYIPPVDKGIASWIGGHFVSIVITCEPGAALLRYCRDATSNGHTGVVMRMLSEPIVVPSDPRDSLYVLNETGNVFLKSQDVAFFTPLFGNGLFSMSDRKEHEYHRRVLSPAFSAAAVKCIVMGAAAPVWQRFVAQLLAKCDKQTRRLCTTLQHEISKEQLGIISRASFRADGFEEHVELTDFTNSFSALMAVGPTIFNMLPAKLVRQQKELRKKIGEVVKREVAATRRLGAPLASGDEEEDITMNRKSNLAIIDHLALAPGVSDLHALDHSATLLLAGHETTASATIWILYHLACNAADQQLVFEELSACFSLDSTPPFDDVVSLPYLRFCILESLRVTPVISNLSRRCVEDTILPFSGVFVPKGCDLNVPIFAVNRSKEIWGEDADEYRPSRWIQNEEVAREAEDTGLGFVAFSVGGRNCIGKQMALRMLQTSVATICRKFELRFPADKNPRPVKRKLGIGIVPEEPFVLELIARSE